MRSFSFSLVVLAVTHDVFDVLCELSLFLGLASERGRPCELQQLEALSRKRETQQNSLADLRPKASGIT